MTILASWDGEGFKPIGRYVRQCDAEMIIGQVYTLDVILERSDNTHRHMFAAIHDAWMNLREGDAERFPSAEHLRKWALIKAGYYINADFACSSSAEAIRLAAYIKGIDDYAVVVVKGSVVQRLVAKSQSYRSMDKKEFQESKEKVLGIVSEMLGVTKTQLEKATA
jgi:predicted DNA binding protein